MFLNNTEESIQNISEMWRRILILPNFCLLLSELNVVCDKICTCWTIIVFLFLGKFLV